ncbi:hypothetical protein C8N25_104171 [Algoriphagus antarcticus]|uniref:Uncharacterized protein n=1 Tax=Algoriphagus antarcticus TaxID=238540 RepID=A0A3E0DZQ9_9BACT|nr:hypothetical protein C8N25_104171 [Algoriphagus antarcticus]
MIGVAKFSKLIYLEVSFISCKRKTEGLKQFMTLGKAGG